MRRKIDLLLKNGMVIDFSRKNMHKTDIAICNGLITEYDSEKNFEIEETIDAEGYFVTPGWIDGHIHVFDGGTESGLPADVVLPSMGVTSVIDAGSAGYGNWQCFRKDIVNGCKTNVFYLLNVSPSGQITERYPEDINPQNYDMKKFCEIMLKDKNHIKGLKLRFSKDVIGAYGLNVLDKCLELANNLNCQLVVHITNPPCEMSNIVKKMRSGDVLCHIYHGIGNTILDSKGKIKKEIWDARERGVYFDTADARTNHSYKVINEALRQGFKPDIISTDLTKASVFRNMCWGLPVVMSKYLNMGMTLEEVIKASTYTPAKVYKLNNDLGSLENGKSANVTVFKISNKQFSLTNKLNENFTGNRLIIPEMTILNGEIAYRSLEFSF